MLVFVSVRGLSLVAESGGHSSSRCSGLSLSQPLLLRSTGSRRAGSVVVAHGPSCSAACGIFPDQGSNPCPLHWQADSQPLHHQASPYSSSFWHDEEEGEDARLNYKLTSEKKVINFLLLTDVAMKIHSSFNKTWSSDKSRMIYYNLIKSVKEICKIRPICSHFLKSNYRKVWIIVWCHSNTFDKPSTITSMYLSFSCFMHFLVFRCFNYMIKLF